MNVSCYALLSFFVCTVAVGGRATEHSGNAAWTEASAFTASSHFTTIDLDKASHFTAPDGSDVAVPSGIYRVEGSAGTNLRLVADATQAAQEISATSLTHKETLTAPFEFAVREEEQENTVHLLLLLPGGTGLDAAGRMGDVQTRGGDIRFRPRSQYTGVVMQLGRVKMDKDIVNETDRQTQQYTKVEIANAEASDAQARLKRCDICKLLNEMRK